MMQRYTPALILNVVEEIPEFAHGETADTNTRAERKEQPLRLQPMKRQELEPRQPLRFQNDSTLSI
jgi:hypothetical protein